MRRCASLPFFFNDTATTEIYTLSLHDALPIWNVAAGLEEHVVQQGAVVGLGDLHGLLHGTRGQADLVAPDRADHRSEEHTSELQSHLNIVCRLLLEKKKAHVIALRCHIRA